MQKSKTKDIAKVNMGPKKMKKAIKERYGKIASEGGSCCGPKTVSCGCTGGSNVASKMIGYSDSELGSLPEGTDLGLGCGNPTALSSIKEGETVLDLGSGAGIDCFLAAQKVGKKGKVLGVDMTSEMLQKARENARTGGFDNVEFRKGEIEDLPVNSGTVDLVISNCVINLSPDKPMVFKEAFRVLKKGGRLMVSDLVLTKKLPKAIAESVSAYVGCVAGALLKEDYIKAIKDAGFKDVRIISESRYPVEVLGNDPMVKDAMKKMTVDELQDAAGSVLSLKVSARKN